MTASDDEHDDDAQLRQLRSVWVSMRDEEPSDRGLASLMAAARAKASELEDHARPSWWQRIGATLRRPPVLALATVTVLLGGALLVTQKSATLEATAPADRTERAEGTDLDGRASGSAAQIAEPSASGAATAPAPASPPPLAAPDAESRTYTPATPPGSAGGVPPQSSVRRDASFDAKLRENAPSRPTPKSTPRTTSSSSTSRDSQVGGAGPGGAGPGDSFAKDKAKQAAAAPVTRGAVMADEAPVSPDPAAPSPTETTAPAKAQSPGSRPAPATPAPPSEPAPELTIEQLVKQCELAAARGDCAGVRLIARKIGQASPGVYKQRIGTNAAVSRCLAGGGPTN